jgi:tRNA-(ms[2]io[6]A)-hydroxylase
VEAGREVVTQYAFELGYATPPEWASHAAAEPLLLLGDHAHCELQAAVACSALIARYPDRPQLVDLAARVISEEMVHFRRVVALLRELGGELGDTGPNPYAEGLRKGSSGTRKSGLLDRLLLAALIERRSCERFELLAASGADPRLVDLYADLAPEEVEHQRLFLETARSECPDANPDRRLAELVAVEAALVPGLPFSPRMHSGPPPR